MPRPWLPEPRAWPLPARRQPAPVFAFAGFEGMAAKFKEEPTVRLKLGRGRSETTVEVFDRPPRRPSVISVANPAGGADIPVEVNDPAAAQFASRLRKVARERRKWAAREGVACYRLYDADVPEYACAIDLYEGAAEAEGELYAHVAEYAPPKSVDPERPTHVSRYCSPWCPSCWAFRRSTCFPSPPAREGRRAVPRRRRSPFL